MTISGMKAMIENYRSRYGKVDEVTFFHGGVPTAEEIAICDEVPWKLAVNPLDCTRSEAKRCVQNGMKAIELEVGSLCDDVLHASKKGYTFEYIRQQVQYFHERGVQVGLVLTPGMYGSSYQHTCTTTERCSELRVSFVRIYPVCVYEGTTLAIRYREDRFTPLSLSQTVTIVREMTDRLAEVKIDVIRIGRQGRQDGLATPIAGPIHSNIRGLVENRKFFDMIAAQLCTTAADIRQITIHPKDISLVKGVGGDTIRHLRARLERNLVISCDEAVPRGTVQIGRKND